MAHALQRVVRDPDLGLPAFNEAVRVDMPTQLMCRLLLEDKEIHGHQLREGQPVELLYASANRDEREFPDPERYVSTGAGERLCAAWGQLQERAVLPWPEDAESADRHALDAAMLEGIGLPAELGPRIREATTSLLTERIELARALRRRRRGTA